MKAERRYKALRGEFTLQLKRLYPSGNKMTSIFCVAARQRCMCFISKGEYK